MGATLNCHKLRADLVTCKCLFESLFNQKVKVHSINLVWQGQESNQKKSIWVCQRKTELDQADCFLQWSDWPYEWGEGDSCNVALIW